MSDTKRFAVVRYRTDGTGDPEIVGFIRELEHIDAFLGAGVKRFKAADGTVMYDTGDWDYVYGVEVVITNDGVTTDVASEVRKKALLGLAACTSSAYDCENCPYSKYTINCAKHLMRDALVALTTGEEER